MNRETIFSDDRKYRYTLWRQWDAEILLTESDPAVRAKASQFVQFIGLNPSTATETEDDPTIRRCIAYAKAWGYGAMCMTNLFAFRATDPKVMKAQEYPIEEKHATLRLNNVRIFNIADTASLIICAWGKHGAHLNRGDDVCSLMRTLFHEKIHHLGLNGDGSPKHPLYLKKTLQPIPWI